MTASRDPRYPPLECNLPAHLVARLQATATVLETTPERLVAAALEALTADLPTERRDLVDRIAASLLHAHEL
jgi:hypothetical protein